MMMMMMIINISVLPTHLHQGRRPPQAASLSGSCRCEFHWRAWVGDNISCQWSEMVGDDENKSSTHVLCPRTWSQTPDQTCKTGWVKEDMKIFGSRHLRPENILHLGPSNIQHLRPENILHLSPARLRTVPPPSLTVNSSPLPPFLDHQVTRMIINECYNKSQDINAVSPFWTKVKLFL